MQKGTILRPEHRGSEYCLPGPYNAGWMLSRGLCGEILAVVGRVGWTPQDHGDGHGHQFPRGVPDTR